MLGYLAFELRRVGRIRGLLVFSSLLPTAFYVVFTVVGGDDVSALHRGVPIAAFAMVSVAGWGAVVGVLSHSSGVAYERSDGWLRQLRTTPLPPSRVVAARGMVATLTVLPPIVAVGAAAVLLHDVSLPVGRWLTLVLVMWLGTVPFALLGLALGYTLPREVTGAATTAVWLALAGLGGLLVPVESFPSWLQAVSRALPSHQYAELGWSAIGAVGATPATAAYLAVWTVVFGVLAAAAYRRSSAVR
ncbi:ABC transporter permease [Natronosporangium hydrolyticum]|uniref:ABC transporter permease n=1 Tax=Natronosporangium hydrolyticum TaxID=2811111 RepID=A0A895YM69_9ACTN|nr:ABC transporter permease [Natronosporangium hydrolyticum]QSB16579.1 ABC transporter permease [Natronosporangium hydrolyticum]